MRDDEKIFSNFDEFERDELRRMESMSASVDAMIASLFGFEVDLEGAGRRAGDSSGELCDADEP